VLHHFLFTQQNLDHRSFRQNMQRCLAWSMQNPIAASCTIAGVSLVNAAGDRAGRSFLDGPQKTFTPAAFFIED